MLKRADGLRLAKLQTEGVPLDGFAALARQDVGGQTQEVVDAEGVLGDHQVDHLLAGGVQASPPGRGYIG